MQTWPNFAFTVAYTGSGGALSLTPLAGAIAFTGYAPTVASSGVVITPSIVEARSSGVAPLSVFFDASGTTAASLTSKPFHELVYVWSFGDTAGGATWSYGARAGLSKNQAFGPVASHVFETDGSYTVTLTVFHFDSGGTMSSASTTQTITVTDADTVFSGTNTIVFATDGVFTGKPTGAQEVTTSNYDTAINTYKATGKRLLFKKGQTFTATAPAVLNVDGPGIVGAWGSGAAPKWIIATNYSALSLSYQSTAGIKDWRVMDIEMDGQDRFTAGVGGDGGIDQALLLRLNIHNVDNGVLMSHSILDYHNNNGHPGHLMWDQFAMVDCRVNTIHGGVPAAGYVGAYVSANRYTFMGNDMDSANGGGHVTRTPYIGRGVVSNNYYANSKADKHLWQMHAPGQTNTGVCGGGLYTEKVVVSDNTFSAGAAVWGVFVGPQNTGVDERLRNIIFERNYFVAGAGTTSAMSIRGPLSAFTIRNNIVNMSVSGTSGVTGFETGDGGVGPVTTDINYLHNTVYSAGTGEFRAVTVGTTQTNITVKNNLGYAPNASTAALLVGSGASGLSSSNNSSNSQTKSTPPSFSSIPTTATQLSSSDFKVTGGSYAIDAGAYAFGVFRDFQDVVRTLPADIGAIQA